MSWDRTIPATSAALASSPVRANFQSIDQSLMGQNLVRDPAFLIWAGGDAVAPSHWKVTGGPTIARETASGKWKAGGMAPSLTGSATGVLVQTILNTTDFELAAWGDVPFSVGCWVRSDTASVARLTLHDGNDATNGDYHTGGDSFEWLTVTKTLHASLSTKLELHLESKSATAITYHDLPSMILGEIPPQHPILCRTQRGVLYFPQGTGNAIAGIRKGAFKGERPFRVENTTLFVETAPTGAALIVDINHDQSGTPTTMFATRPQIAIAAKQGGTTPDGTYQNRCFQGGSDSDGADDRLLTVDIDQIGSAVAGANLAVLIRTLQFVDPFEALRATSSIGNE